MDNNTKTKQFTYEHKIKSGVKSVDIIIVYTKMNVTKCV